MLDIDNFDTAETIFTGGVIWTMAKSKGDTELQLQGSSLDQDATMSDSKSGRLIKKFQLLLQKFQILNFMVVGGIGWVINMLVLWQLTPFFKSNSYFPGTTY